MSASNKNLLARLEAMPLEGAHIAIHTLAFGKQIESPNHGVQIWISQK